MGNIVYVEREALEHPRTQSILARYKHSHVQVVERYGEIFNGHNQNFRVQKQNPALVLALKRNKFVHSTPPQYETGGGEHYYFSHMLNCLYDCRYCFLQGMFKSAHYLLFVNYEEFVAEIQRTAEQHAHNNKPTWFFSGYDCDSLAFEPITKFADFFIDAFSHIPNAILELRTKSTQIRPLLKRSATNNVVVAASLSPASVAEALEHGAPSLAKRLQALASLQQHGWRIGIRFDPIIWHKNYQAHYQELVEQVFSSLDGELIDSVTLGGFRVPKDFFKTMYGLYPDETLFNIGLEQRDAMVTYRSEVQTQTLGFVQDCCAQYIDAKKIYSYDSNSQEVVGG